MSSKPSERTGVRLAIPNKGRISEPIRDIIARSGLHIRESGSRALLATTNDPGVEVMFARPVDIPAYVAGGAADIGITGRDLVMERGADVAEILDFGLGKATLVLAAPEDAGIKNAKDLEGLRVATEFPGLAASYFEKHGVSVDLIPVGGACEATPHLGIADAIIDLTSSGTTLKTNRLEIIEEILVSTSILIANHGALIQKGEKVDELRVALESVINAEGQCYLMMNVPRSELDLVKKCLPGLGGPTVMDVASDGNLVAVHAVVSEASTYRLISRLKKAGARDILIVPVDRMIR